MSSRLFNSISRTVASKLVVSNRNISIFKYIEYGNLIIVTVILYHILAERFYDWERFSAPISKMNLSFHLPLAKSDHLRCWYNKKNLKIYKLNLLEINMKLTQKLFQSRLGFALGISVFAGFMRAR